MKSLVLAICLLCSTVWAQGQHGFLSMDQYSLDELMSHAQNENKFILLKIGAPWCKPCINLTSHFNNPDLVTYLEEHYVKANLDLSTKSLSNSFISEQYQVVFLPTLLWLDKNGRILFRSEEVIPSATILQISQEIREKVDINASNSTLSQTPFNPTLGKVDTLILNDLYRKAYQKLERGDKSYEQEVEQYLSHNGNWSNTKTLRFILDFVKDVRSRTFDYLISNKSKFIEEFGRKEVFQKIKSLVELHLKSGFPRPRIDESIVLFQLINPKDYIHLAYFYMLRRPDILNRFELHQSLAQEFLQQNEVDSTEVYYLQFQSCMMNFEENNQSTCLSYINQSIRLVPKNPLYLDSRASYYFQLKQWEKARMDYQVILSLPHDPNISYDFIQNQIKEIESKL